MHFRNLLFISFIFFGCNNYDNGSVIDKNLDVKINASGNNIRDRILAPTGYNWVNEEPNSFGAYLQNIQLKEDKSPILDYTGSPIPNQSEHVAILNYDLGNKDLQQCADAVIRLRAEYLFERGNYSEIAFHFTSGDLFTWEQYR